MTRFDSLIYCLDDDLHLICMPYSDENIRMMAEHLKLVRNWLVSGRHKYYEVPLHEAQRIASQTLRVSHGQLISVIERTLYIS